VRIGVADRKKILGSGSTRASSSGGSRRPAAARLTEVIGTASLTWLTVAVARRKPRQIPGLSACVADQVKKILGTGARHAITLVYG
jgi:hypothetical protein